MGKEICGVSRASETAPLFEEAAEFVLKEGHASAAIIRHRFRLGDTRCARLTDQPEKAGIVGPPTAPPPAADDTV